MSNSGVFMKPSQVILNITSIFIIYTVMEITPKLRETV